VRDDDLDHTRCAGARASPPETDGRAPHAKIEVAVDDGYDEAGRADDLRRRRFATNRRDLCAAELALRDVRSAAGSDEPDEQQSDP
jgi:hypothetical protein